MARGLGKRQVAKRFNVSPDSVHRHWSRHCPEAVKVAHKVKWAAPKADLDKLTLAEADGVLTYLQRLRADLLTLFEAAKADGHYPSIAAISRELREVLGLTARVTGELTAANAKAASVVNVATSEEYLAMRAQLITVLRRHPNALRDVLETFGAFEAKATTVMQPAPALIEAQPEIEEEAPHEPGS
jgi:hypothetical protein